MTHEELVEKVATSIRIAFDAGRWSGLDPVEVADKAARVAVKMTGEAALKVSDEIEDGVVETICKHPNPSEIEGLDGLLVPLFRARMKIKSLTQGNTP